MNKTIKRAGLIHDVVAYGRAGLMNITPLITGLGVQPCPLPTVVFSTHTGYNKPVIKRLDGFLSEALEHFMREEINLDIILVGYIGYVDSIIEIKEFIEYYKNRGTKIILDPICGDNGKLYSNISLEYVEALKDIISLCDIVIPNLTEARLLTGETELHSIAQGLITLGAENVIITGAGIGEETLDIAISDKKGFRKIELPSLPISFHGTGDMFSAMITGYYVNNVDLDTAIKEAHNFIYYCIQYSIEIGYPASEGILIEKCINKLKQI